MSQAFISWTTAIQQDLMGPYGKFAALFFDELIIQVPRADAVDQVLASLVEQGLISGDVARELGAVWRPVHAVLPDYEFLKHPWQHDDERLVELARTAAVEDALAEYPDIDSRGLQHEVAWAGAGLIEAVSTWSILHTRRPCALLADRAESRIVEGVFGISIPPPNHALFSQVMQWRLPTAGNLSWERLFELRSSPFLDAFRQKMAELDRLVKEGGDERDARAIVEELERNDLRELARTVTPDTQKAWAKAVMSNVPLPIPINPASVALSAIDVKTIYDRKQRFGWLYFLLEADRAA
jgi:hypothetical protein